MGSRNPGTRSARRGKVSVDYERAGRNVRERGEAETRPAVYVDRAPRGDTFYPLPGTSEDVRAIAKLWRARAFVLHGSGAALGKTESGAGVIGLVQGSQMAGVNVSLEACGGSTMRQRSC